MKEVRFIVTGACEHALAASLAGCFPPGVADFKVAAPQVDSFTSTPLVGTPPRGVVALIDKFVARLMGEVEAHPGALVVGVDDLELDADQTRLHNAPEHTVAAVQAAVQRQLGVFWSSAAARKRAEAELRERCSFHLLVPMVEAYFFGEPDALLRAGAVRSSLFDASAADVEKFKVDDPVYLSEPELPLSAPREARKRTWAKAVAERARHPKLYLKFLCSPDDPLGDVYREVRGRGEKAGFSGAEALRSLNWTTVTKFKAGATFARSLIADIADFLSIRPSPVPGLEAPETSIGTHRQTRTLRNL